MHMDVRHDLPAGITDAWRLLQDDAYRQAQRAHTDTTGEVISEENCPDGTRLRRTRVTLGRDLPKVATNLLGERRLAYTLEENIDDARHRIRWKVIVDRVASKVRAEGTFSLEPIDDNTCLRVVTGEIKVSVPLIGSRIEKGIAEDLTRSYESTAHFARQWLAEHI